MRWQVEGLGNMWHMVSPQCLIVLGSSTWCLAVSLGSCVLLLLLCPLPPLTGPRLVVTLSHTHFMPQGLCLGFLHHLECPLCSTS